MDERSCVATMAFGMEAVAGGADLLAVGEMGIGNTTVAAAIYAALYGGAPEAWVGRGTGVDNAGYARKIDAVTGALARHAGHLDDPLEVLRRLGGREVAAIAGAIVAARLQRIPVVLDGYVAAPRRRCCTRLTRRARPLRGRPPLGRRRPSAVLDRLGKSPCSISGCGSAKAPARRSRRRDGGAAACHRDMATFGEAGVGGQDRRLSRPLCASPPLRNPPAPGSLFSPLPPPSSRAG